MNFDIKTEELANDAYVIALTGEIVVVDGGRMTLNYTVPV